MEWGGESRYIQYFCYKNCPFSRQETFAPIQAAMRPSIMLASRGFTVCDRKSNSPLKRKLQPWQVWKTPRELHQPEKKKNEQSRNLTSVLTASRPSSSLCSTSREKTATQWMAWIIHRRVEIDHISYPVLSWSGLAFINNPHDTFINPNCEVRPPHHPINYVFDQIKVKLIKPLGDTGSGKLLKCAQSLKSSGITELVRSGAMRGFDATQRVWSGCPGYDECGDGPGLLWQMSHFWPYIPPFMRHTAGCY